jgi:signal transduction histidine kinase
VHLLSRLAGAGRLARPQDLVWLILFSAMAAVSPTRDPLEILTLLSLALLQVMEQKAPFFSTREGTAFSIFLKLLMGYLLIGSTGGVNSSYYLILLLPVVSAATSYGIPGAALFTTLACAGYLSCLLYVDFSRYTIDPDQKRELFLRVAFLAAAGFLTNTLAAANREQAKRHRAVAEQLAEANLNLQAAEDAVRRSDRLAALGQLTAGLAHELRNPLGTIKGSADMLAKSLSGENEVAREMAGFISSEVDRTNSLVSRFLDFARPMHLRLAPAELGEVIDRAVTQLERLGSRVAVFKNYSPEIAPFPMDAELMERVFYNLLLNAEQATSQGGAVTVKTRRADDAAFAEIAVIDRGSGIDSKHLESIFNPFFTTKSGGVGLGLAIVSKIVDEHGGRMSVESEPGKGSVFRVFLPLESAAR